MNIVIVSHKYLTQPDDELVSFLKDKKVKRVVHITHSFSDSPHRKSNYRIYELGKLKKDITGKDYKNLPEPLIYLKELLFTLNSLFKIPDKIDLYIGMDGMCVLFGLISKIFFKVKKTIFWSIDFVPNNRFKESWKNFIYKKINYYSYKKADEVWDLSPRMIEARKKYLGINESDYKKFKIVPYGMWVGKIKTFSYEEVDPFTIVFMGHLLEKQGVQLVLRALPNLITTFPDIKFKIIGGGKYATELKKISKELKVEQFCNFMGKIDDIKKLEVEVAKSTVAIAPYIKSLDTWTYYADPGKVKTYLACGVPVLLTDIPWNAKEISQKKCGIIIQENIKSIVTSLSFLLKKENNIEYRRNAKNYSKQYDYKDIFENLEII